MKEKFKIDEHKIETVGDQQDWVRYCYKDFLNDESKEKTLDNFVEYLCLRCCVTLL
jgi:hypothetical protein